LPILAVAEKSSIAVCAKMPITHAQRRSGGDRRSGFDRRSTIGPKGSFIVDRRQKDSTPPTGPDVDTFLKALIVSPFAFRRFGGGNSF